jgi:hypothetical protein
MLGAQECARRLLLEWIKYEVKYACYLFNNNF